MQKEVLIFFNEIADKNVLQAKCIRQLHLKPVFFVTTPFEKELPYIQPEDVHFLKNKDLIERTGYILNYLRKRKKRIKHIEVYPGGRFSFMIVLLARLFSIRCICAERGDLLYYNPQGYDRMTRFSMWVCYHFSQLVWFRELYMEARLKKMGVKRTFFLHNAIKIPSEEVVTENKDIDFLWLNRIIPQRRSDWLADVLQEPEFSKTNNLLVGYLKETLFEEEQEKLMRKKPANLSIQNYVLTDVATYYKRAKFFVFPSEVVFANNALLEAMSHGVVPLVSRQTGTELIVEDGKSGIVFDHSQNELETAMKKALQLQENEYNLYAEEARKKVLHDFSEVTYFKNLAKMYALV